MAGISIFVYQNFWQDNVVLNTFISCVCIYEFIRIMWTALFILTYVNIICSIHYVRKQSKNDKRVL